MKKLIWVIILVLLLGIGYQNRAVLASQVEKVTYYSSCDAPIRYKIGTIDDRFNITKEQFKQDVEEASSIWSTAAGKQLFVYDPEGPLTVSLEYDERQSLNSQINELDTKLDEQNKKLEPEIAAYEQQVAAFKQKATQLNNEIDEWNKKGGAPMDVYKGLVERQKALQAESRQLQARASELGQSTEAYNSEVQELSQTVDTYNEALKFKPEEGIYIQDQEGRRIIIYFYNTKTELVHTLAHELGHALGLDHIANTKAVMFSRTNNAVILTDEDLSALTEVCRKRSIAEIAQERISYILSQFKKS
jgi:predicted Zn-dependent protease